jgi:hypothetical protein
MYHGTGYQPQPTAGSGCHHLPFSLVARACRKQVRYGPYARDLRPMLRPPERAGSPFLRLAAIAGIERTNR